MRVPWTPGIAGLFFGRLDSLGLLPHFFLAAPAQVRGVLLAARQAPTSDHVVGTTRGRRGRDVRRFTFGEGE
jgi:hypothetical protein